MVRKRCWRPPSQPGVLPEFSDDSNQFTLPSGTCELLYLTQSTAARTTVRPNYGIKPSVLTDFVSGLSDSWSERSHLVPVVIDPVRGGTGGKPGLASRAYAREVADDRDRDLGTVLSYLVGRPVRGVELAQALGVARSSYYAARDDGRLITADNLLRLADVFGLNPVDLLVRYGLVTHDAAVEYTQNAGSTSPRTDSAETAGLRPRMDLPPL